MISKVCGISKDTMGVKTQEFFETQVGRKVDMLFSYITWMKDDKIVATSMYDNYTRGSVQLHFISTIPLTRSMIRDTFCYPFIELNCNIIIAKFPRGNSRSHKTVGKFGFKYLATIPGMYGKGKEYDGLVFTMNKKSSEKWVNYGVV